MPSMFDRLQYLLQHPRAALRRMNFRTRRMLILWYQRSRNSLQRMNFRLRRFWFSHPLASILSKGLAHVIAADRQLADRLISRLRSKLEPHGVVLRSIRGFGYRLELAGDRPAP